MQEHRAEVAALGAGIDPHKSSYRAFGLGRSGWWGVTLQPLLEDPLLGLRRLRHANLRRSAAPHSDVLQLPGVAIVDRDGVLRFLHRSRRTDDLPSIGRILSVLRKVAA